MKETKKFCDICKKEIKHSEGAYLIMKPTMGHQMFFRLEYDDLCNEHASKIYDAIKRIEEEE